MNIIQPPVLTPVDEKGEKVNDRWKPWFDNVFRTLSSLFGTSGGSVLQLPYGAFDCTTTQTQTVINTPKRVALDTAQVANTVTFATGDGVHVSVPGLYLFTYSTQLTNADTAAHDIDIWLRKNGVDVDSSASVVTVPGTHGGQPGYAHASEVQPVQLVAGDYIEVWWATNSLQVQLAQLPAITTPFHSPSAPAVSVLMTFVSA